MIVGHKELVRDFRKLAEKGRLAHGYIFFGEPEVGKFSFAKHLANFLENKEWETGQRPLQDALILEDASGIDAMRDLKNFLWQKPNTSSRRIAVINNAENLTTEAQNAILKIAEEPPENSLVLLIVNQLDNILPPLLSRMQKIYFGKLSEKEMEEFRAEFKIKGMSSEDPIGHPGRFAKLLDSEDYGEAEKFSSKFLKSSGLVRSKLIKEFLDELRDIADKQPERADRILDMFFELTILELRKDPVNNFAVLRDILHRLFLIKSYNTNKRLQLEAI